MHLLVLAMDVFVPGEFAPVLECLLADGAFMRASRLVLDVLISRVLGQNEGRSCDARDLE